MLDRASVRVGVLRIRRRRVGTVLALDRDISSDKPCGQDGDKASPEQTFPPVRLLLLLGVLRLLALLALRGRRMLGLEEFEAKRTEIIMSGW
ncbi:MAG TPA: hypothetical protein VFJ22_05605 [Dermatophilaceae bacterium]|nr:hypothetical protein [Dermatophilaceae bacterium]